LKRWPALDLVSVDDLLLAALDDFSPTASEELDNGWRIFFATGEHRDRAQAALRDRRIAAVAIEVSDEDWAVRSQQNLTPITVGDITVLPRTFRNGLQTVPTSSDRRHHDRHRTVDGLWHRSSRDNRLCLAALQRTPVRRVFSTWGRDPGFAIAARVWGGGRAASTRTPTRFSRRTKT
jgi:hypothetical protein